MSNLVRHQQVHPLQLQLHCGPLREPVQLPEPLVQPVRCAHGLLVGPVDDPQALQLRAGPGDLAQASQVAEGGRAEPAASSQVALTNNDDDDDEK